MTDIPHLKEKQFYYADPEHRWWRWRRRPEYEWNEWVTNKEPAWVSMGEYQVEEYRPKFTSGALSEAPKHGATVWSFHLGANQPYSMSWSSSYAPRLACGRVFPDEESAQRAMDAVMELLGRKE